MIVLLSCLTILVFCLLVLSAALRPIRAEVSQFELQRQAKRGGALAKRMLEREATAADIQAILHLDTATMLVVFTCVAVASFGWGIGITLALLAALTHRGIGALPPVRRVARALYERLEPRLLNAAQKAHPVLSRLGASPETASMHTIHSKDELLHLVRQAKHILSADEIAQVVHGLDFSHQRVTDHMTPRESIDTVADTELLGPITLDALYKTGHTRLPVIEADLDHVVGILHVQDLLVATSKETPTAREAMHTPVHYIAHDQSLPQVLGAFLATHQTMALVVDAGQKVVGLVTLRAVLEVLLGRELEDTTKTAHGSATAKTAAHSKKL